MGHQCRQFGGLLIGCVEHPLLHRQQQLGHHVPVDTAQALKSEHRARTAGELVVLQHTLVSLGQRQQVCTQVGAGGFQVVPVGQRRGKAHHAVALLLQQVAAAAGQQRLHHRQGKCGGVELVALQEARQLAVGIEQEAVAPGLEQRAGKQRVQQRNRLGQRQIAAGQQRDLAFEHRVKLGNIGLPGREVHQVVALEQAIGAPAGVQRGIQQRQQVLRQAGQQSRRRTCEPAARMPLVGGGPPGVEHATRRIEKGAAAGTAVHHLNRCGTQQIAKCGDRVQRRGGQRKGLAGRGQRLQKHQKPPQMGQRDHRQAVAYQGVVGVVPLGPLGVQPQATAGHQTAGLGQQHDHQLFAQRGQHRSGVHFGVGICFGVCFDVCVGVCVGVRVGLSGLHAAHQQPVSTQALRPCQSALVRRLVKFDRLLRAGHHRCVGFEPVRHVGKAEQRTVPKVGQQRRVMRGGGFQQAQQVDQLVITPVTDVAPGVVRFGHLPLDAGAADAVGVVAVGRHCAQKGGDHRAGVVRLAGQQGLPVLKNVAPVALVVQHPLPSAVPYPDGKKVPGPARVAMAPAEGQRQIRQQQPFSLRPEGAGHRLQRGRTLDLGRPIGRKHRKLCADRPVALQAKVQQVGGTQPGAVGKYPAAHDVEQHVGLVVGAGHHIGRSLESVGAGQQVIEPGVIAGQRGVDLLGGTAACGKLLRQLEDLQLRPGAVDHLLPGQSGGADFGLEIHQKSTRATAGQALALRVAAVTKRRQLVRRQQCAGARRQAGMPGHQRVERFLGLGTVPNLGVQGVERQPAAGRGLVPLVGVGQHAHGGGMQHAHTRRHQVEHAVEHLNTDRTQRRLQPG